MSSKYGDVLDGFNCKQIPMYYIFLESSGEKQLNGSDIRHHDDHQENQDDQECPPSMGMFFMALISRNTHVLYIDQLSLTGQPTAYPIITQAEMGLTLHLSVISHQLSDSKNI